MFINLLRAISRESLTMLSLTDGQCTGIYMSSDVPLVGVLYDQLYRILNHLAPCGTFQFYAIRT